MDAIDAVIDFFPEMASSEVKQFVLAMVGKPCCAQTVGEYRSLSIGFGMQQARPKHRLATAIVNEFEVGSYTAAWRIISKGKLLCGSMNPVNATSELDDQLGKIAIGNFLKIEMTTKFDVRIRTDNGVDIEFICASNEDDECFHIIGTNQLCVEYTLENGWRIGSSRTPWV